MLPANPPKTLGHTTPAQPVHLIGQHWRIPLLRDRCYREFAGNSPWKSHYRQVSQYGGDYLNSVPYLSAISRICSRVSCLGGTPGGLQVSRKKPSRAAGAIIQSKSSS